eukprot:169507_1
MVPKTKYVFYYDDPNVSPDVVDPFILNLDSNEPHEQEGSRPKFGDFSSQEELEWFYETGGPATKDFACVEQAVRDVLYKQDMTPYSDLVFMDENAYMPNEPLFPNDMLPGQYKRCKLKGELGFQYIFKTYTDFNHMIGAGANMRCLHRAQFVQPIAFVHDKSTDTSGIVLPYYKYTLGEFLNTDCGSSDEKGVLFSDNAGAYKITKQERDCKFGKKNKSEIAKQKRRYLEQLLLSLKDAVIHAHSQGVFGVKYDPGSIMVNELGMPMLTNVSQCHIAPEGEDLKRLIREEKRDFKATLDLVRGKMGLPVKSADMETFKEIFDAIPIKDCKKLNGNVFKTLQKYSKKMERTLHVMEYLDADFRQKLWDDGFHMLVEDIHVADKPEPYSDKYADYYRVAFKTRDGYNYDDGSHIMKAYKPEYYGDAQKEIALMLQLRQANCAFPVKVIYHPGLAIVMKRYMFDLPTWAYNYKLKKSGERPFVSALMTATNALSYVEKKSHVFSTSGAFHDLTFMMSSPDTAVLNNFIQLRDASELRSSGGFTAMFGAAEEANVQVIDGLTDELLASLRSKSPKKNVNSAGVTELFKRNVSGKWYTFKSLRERLQTAYHGSYRHLSTFSGKGIREKWPVVYY